MKKRRETGSPLGLRSRLTVTFALVTLAATLLVSVTTFLLARSYLVEQRERGAIRQTFLNARLARDLLQSGDQEPQAILDLIAGEAGSLALLNIDGQWFASGVAADPSDLPKSLIEVLAQGDAGHQRVSRAGKPRLVVGVPLAERNAQYLEIVSLDNLQRTLRTLMISLLISSGLTTIAGTVIGVYASRRLLRPLQRMSVVAAGITAGDLHARLDAQGDHDLETLVDSFNEMVSALQERIEREQRFTSDVSHELRTPLTVLKAAIELVEQRSPELSPRAMQAVEMLARQVSYFERLVLDLLEISRFDAGVEHAELEETDLVAFLDNVSVDLGGPHVTNETAEPIRTGVDRRRMERILGNLIENAERYAGGVTAITVDRNNGFVEIAVSDAGVGIPIDEREHVFERFWRGRHARHQASKGSGLGLALVAEHVRLLNGTIRIDDAPSGGTKFVVDLPVERAW